MTVKKEASLPLVLTKQQSSPELHNQSEIQIEGSFIEPNEFNTINLNDTPRFKNRQKAHM